MKWLSKLVDDASNYFAHRKGLLPLLGILLVIVNFILPFFTGPNFVTVSNLFLHLGVIIAIFGMMLAWAL
jgi:membrane-bound ClpP family serine protease